MKPTIDYTLYLVTDRDLMSTDTLEDAVEAACKGGVTLVQLREKHASREEFTKLARSIKQVCDTYGVPLIINDEPEIAAEVGAAGVHVGQEDLEASRVREIVGADAIIGVSAHNAEEALAAQAAGADYLGVGALVPTATKPDADIVSHDELKEIIKSVDIPVVAIGGVNESTIPDLSGIGLAGYSIVSAIIAKPDIEQAAHDLRALIVKVES